VPGLRTARHVVTLGASKVILGVRTVSKGLSANSDIETSAGRTGVVEVWELNLKSFASVKAFASRAESLDRVDTGIMNAGLTSLQWNLSPAGWERQIQVNVLSTTLLSLLLLPQLVRIKKTFSDTQPHLVLLGSDVHLDAKFAERNADKIVEELNKEEVWKETAESPERYSVSKLLDLYVAIELARPTPAVGGKPAVIVDVVAPGFCKSEVLTREPGDLRVLKALRALTGRTLQEGSKTVVDAATRGSEAHGQYFDHQKITSFVTGPFWS
jgi:NAD(P)-dependent dehydrogenase (short-subunit alcohol dehydrogenase family)